jgi:acyl-CoA hydrolase
MDIDYTTDFTVFPQDINFSGTLFGGVLLSKMDIAAATLARKILTGTGADGAVTASMDKVDFLKPGLLGDLITIKCSLKSLGKSSMLIKSVVHREDFKGNYEKLCTGIFTFVAVKERKPFLHNISFEKLNQSEEFSQN